VHPSVPAKTVQELVALVRAGKYNNFAIAGAGTPVRTENLIRVMALGIVA